jgi:hypothetical protein
MKNMCKYYGMGKEATMYILFPNMFPKTGFGYAQVHWFLGQIRVCKTI